MQMNSAHHSGTVCLQQTHLMTPVSVVHDSRVSPPGNKRSPTTRRPTSPGRRIHTLRLVRPTDGATICARADRVLPTRHEPRHGMSVCEEYLTTLSCPEESQCSKVHVAAEHVWDFIQLDFDQTRSFCEGFKVHCYMPDMSWYYIIPSEFIFKTRGSADYVTDYNECGINSKNKFTLCTNMVKDKKCMLGRCCKDIHTSLPDLSHVEGNSTHLVDPSWLPKYPRLGSEVVVRVFNQNSGEDYCDFPGDQVLVTEGAEQYLDFLLQGKDGQPKKMQHCAHFRSKKFCRMGSRCSFLHVIHAFPDTGEGYQSPTSRSNSPMSDLSVNVRSRAIATRTPGSQVADMLSKKYSSTADEPRDDQVPYCHAPYLHRAHKDLTLKTGGQTHASAWSGSHMANNGDVVGSGSNPNEGMLCPRTCDVVSSPTEGAPLAHLQPSQGQALDNAPAMGTCSRNQIISPPRRHNPYALAALID